MKQKKLCCDEVKKNIMQKSVKLLGSGKEKKTGPPGLAEKSQLIGGCWEEQERIGRSVKWWDSSEHINKEAEKIVGSTTQV